jgi:glycosyltransferase involved in cell wall biosynthesis
MEKITIGMPVFNDLAFIEKSLDSILNQSYRNFILIISDDCSSDGSDLICKRYAQKDSRIKYIIQPKNIGISKNMNFLLEQAQTPYFMWAADDDLWSTMFIDKLINALEVNKECIVAFCKYDLIDEANNVIEKGRSCDFSDSNKFQRIRKLIKNPDDGFGYGIFRTDEIREVEFPVWLWPNRKTAYNNIFPSLCFYLSKGNYFHYHESSLFFKREKSVESINHVIAGDGSGVKETFSFILRRLNLVLFSFKLIVRASHLGFALRVFPILLYYWFILSSLNQIKLATRSFFKNRKK